MSTVTIIVTIAITKLRITIVQKTIVFLRKRKNQETQR